VQRTSVPDYIFDGDLDLHLFDISKLGYDGVELAVRRPWEVDTLWLGDLLSRAGLKVCNTGTAGVADEGVSLTSPDEDQRKSCLRYLKEYIKFAVTLGGSVSIGIVRGQLGNGLSPLSLQHDWLVEGLRHLAEYALEEFGCNLVVEPLSREFSHLINTVSEGIDLLKDVGAPNVGLLLDTYQMNLEESDMLASMRAANSNIAHFHVSDSNRRYPGSGNIDFEAVVEALREVGYDGYLSLEAEPYPDSYTAAKRTIDLLRYILSH
jgi:sugar phosphate isomerase/epimerase